MVSGSIFLTGATGFLGRYLLRELLAAGHRVTVLARDARGQPARERVDEMVAFSSESLGRRLPRPTVVAGDLALAGLGLEQVDRGWLARNCRAVVHSAACVALRPTLDGEPWKTNVEGTRRLLEICRRTGLTELQHVSTAFVCGKRAGPVPEDELEAGQEFRNEYEHSKHEAEKLVRAADGMRVTVHRPSVIVGDSVTGHTSSYHGFYRFLELGDRLAEPASEGRRRLPLRLPFGGDEPRNLVPVDWVAGAITRLLDRTHWHGLTFHLTSPEPAAARLVREVAQDVLGIDGVTRTAPGEMTAVGPLEESFLEHLQEYRPYLDGDPVFDCRNARTALRDFPCPRVDRNMLARLIRFAVADRWGWANRRRSSGRVRLDCADYVERFFPESASGSALSQVPIDVTLGLEVRGPGGGGWIVRLRPGEPAEVERGQVSGVPIIYRTDAATFEAIVRGRQTPQEAFFSRRIEVVGDVEKALKLAVLFGQFVREFPYPSSPVPEKPDAARVSV
jgi:nucleoside-diphosphate-sugar epimerase